MASARQPGPPRASSPSWHPRTPTPRRLRMSSDLTSPGTISTASTGLELDDIQRGVLHQRPSPYAGTYLLLRIGNREAGRQLVRRLYPVIESAQTSADPAQDASIAVAFTYQGLKALGVPQDSLDS